MAPSTDPAPGKNVYDITLTLTTGDTLIPNTGDVRYQTLMPKGTKLKLIKTGNPSQTVTVIGHGSVETDKEVTKVDTVTRIEILIPKKKSKTNLGLIIGASVGGAVLITLIVLLIVYRRR